MHDKSKRTRRTPQIPGRKPRSHFRAREVEAGLQYIRKLCNRCNGFQGPMINARVDTGELTVTYAKGIVCRCTEKELQLWECGSAR